MSWHSVTERWGSSAKLSSKMMRFLPGGARTWYPIAATKEAETEGSQVQVQLELQSWFKASLVKLVRPILKIKIKRGL